MVGMRSKIQASLMGVMIGDAIGMPVEMMTPEQILKMTDGKGISTFVEPIQRKLADTQGLKAGSTTDDWQLTRAVTESLLRCGGFNMYDMALGHVEAYETSTSGWGTTTRVGMEQLKEYFDTRGKSGRRPGKPAPPVTNSRGQITGCGNGVAMKIAPMGFYSNVRYNEIQTLGELTHPDQRASSAAFAVAWIISSNLHKPISSYKILEKLIKELQTNEDIWDEEHTDTFSSRLARLRDDTLLYGPIELLRQEIGTDCLALESVCFAIALFLRTPDDFRKGVLTAVNSGGDADSTASMVGAMIGSNVGLDGIPKEWVEFSPNFKEAAELGGRFADHLGVP